MQQRGQATGKQRCSNQQADIRRRQPGCLADDQRHGDDAAIHGEHMLQAVSHVGGDAQIFIFGPLR